MVKSGNYRARRDLPASIYLLAQLPTSRTRSRPRSGPVHAAQGLEGAAVYSARLERYGLLIVKLRTRSFSITSCNAEYQRVTTQYALPTCDADSKLTRHAEGEDVLAQGLAARRCTMTRRTDGMTKRIALGQAHYLQCTDPATENTEHRRSRCAANGRAPCR